MTPADLTTGAAPLAVGPKFCVSCGATWQSGWRACEECVRHVARSQAAALSGPRGGRTVALVIVLYFAILLANIVTAIIALVAWGETPEASVWSEFAMALVDSIIILAWIGLLWQRVRSSLTTFPGPRWYLAAIGLSPVTYGVAAVVVRAMEWVGLEALSYSEDFLASGFGWSSVFLVVSVQPAVFEELAFRGVIFGGLRSVLDERETILVSSLMFMVMHLSVPSFPHLLLIGLALGYLRSRTGSLYPGMLLHFAHNSICLAGEALGF